MDSTPVQVVEASAYTIPTEGPESDGTLRWDATTLVLVEARAGGVSGTGFSYTAPAACSVIEEVLAPAVTGVEAADVPAAWQAMVRAVRNLGRPGLVSMAIAAVDNALWDLKARLFGVPLHVLLGRCRQEVPVYGSGGFTSYDEGELGDQLAGWVEQGIGMVKMKVGRDPAADESRVAAARRAIGPETQLFVDANGAYDRKQALRFARAYSDLGVTWFEEPVSSDDLEGLRLLRDSAPPGMDITAGEYGFDLFYFRRMLEAGAVDVIQADVTRCAGVTQLLEVGALCDAFSIPLSTHCAPLMHLQPACSLSSVRHMEYFFDHVRIERMLFRDIPEPVDGALRPDPDRPGSGWEFDRKTAEPYRVR